MKIRTKLILLSVVFAVLVIAIGSIMLLAFRQVNKEIETEHSAHDILKHIFELNIVTHEYLVYHGKRMQRQWHLKYDSLGKLLSDRMWKEEKGGHAEKLSIIKSIVSGYKTLTKCSAALEDRCRVKATSSLKTITCKKAYGFNSSC